MVEIETTLSGYAQRLITLGPAAMEQSGPIFGAVRPCLEARSALFRAAKPYNCAKVRR